MRERAEGKSSVTPAEREEKLLADMERYCQMALEMGAAEAVIVPASSIVQTQRVRMLCYFPRCPELGSCEWCPPYWETPFEDAQAMKDSYKYAVVLRLLIPPDDMTGPLSGGRGRGGVLGTIMDLQAEYWDPELVEYWQDYIEEHGTDKGGAGIIAGKDLAVEIEKAARKDGHYFAFEGGMGSCAATFCHTEEYRSRCIALRSGLCRFPGLSRPEGVVGMYYDWLRTHVNLGRAWRYQDCGWSVLPEDMEGEEIKPGRTTIAFIE